MRTRLLLSAGLLAALACGGDGGGTTDNNPPPGNPPPQSPPVGNVQVGNNFFNPQTLNATVGTRVVWTWAADAVDHNVTFDDGPNSSTQSSGTFERTFSAAGTFPYHCTIHGTAMSGSVVVSASGGATGGGSTGGGGPPNPYD
jgi:hypothetical protein